MTHLLAYNNYISDAIANVYSYAKTCLNDYSTE